MRKIKKIEIDSETLTVTGVDSLTRQESEKVIQKLKNPSDYSGTKNKSKKFKNHKSYSETQNLEQEYQEQKQDLDNIASKLAFQKSLAKRSQVYTNLADA